MEIISLLLLLVACRISTVASVPNVHDLKDSTNLPERTSTQHDDYDTANLTALRKAYYSQFVNFDQGQLGTEIRLLRTSNPNPRRTLVGMISVYREKDEYLYRTLSSVLPALFNSNITSSLQGSVVSTNKVNIFLGSPESDYAKFTRHNSLVNIIPMKEEFWNAPFGYCRDVLTNPEYFIPFKNLNVSIRSAHNYIRMMEEMFLIASDEFDSIFLGSPIDNNALSRLIPRYGLLLLEDDIILISDASTRLDMTVTAIEKIVGNETDYILTCYLYKEHVKLLGGEPSNYKDLNSGSNNFNYSNIRTAPDQFSRYKVSISTPFRHTQCIYMPAITAKKVSDWIRKNYLSPSNSEVKTWLNYDRQLGYFTEIFNIPVFAMHEPIAQHIGKATTGLSGSFHEGIGMVQI